MVLVHILDGARNLINSRQSKVALFEYILLVKLGDGNHVRPLPSVIHDAAVVLWHLVHSIGRSTLTRDVVSAEGVSTCASSTVVWIRHIAAELFQGRCAVLHIMILLRELDEAGVGDHFVNGVAL
jgi:hypothetical protein